MYVKTTTLARQQHYLRVHVLNKTVFIFYARRQTSGARLTR
jgi:hypothetical protein